MSEFTRAYFDAEQEAVIIQRVDENGAVVATSPQITILLDDAFNSLNVPQVIELREWDVCKDNGDGTFTKKKAIFLSSAAY